MQPEQTVRRKNQFTYGLHRTQGKGVGDLFFLKEDRIVKVHLTEKTNQR